MNRFPDPEPLTDLPTLPESHATRVEDCLRRDVSPSPADESDFRDWFDRERFPDGEPIKSTRHTTTRRVETERGTVYVGDVSGTDGQIEGKMRLRSRGYELSKVFSLPIPPFTFGDDWFASKGFDGTDDLGHVVTSEPRFDHFVTDLAKLFPLLNWDISSDILCKPSGEYVHLDVIPRFHNPLGAIYRAYSAIARSLGHGMGIQSTFVDVVTRRARDIALWVYTNRDEFLNEVSFEAHQRRTYLKGLLLLIERLPIAHESPDQRYLEPSLLDTEPQYVFEPADDHWRSADQFLREA